MALFSVVVEQREKEAKAVKFFLLYSSIGSLVLHIGILALGISKFLQRVPETREKPIEITIIETVPQQLSKVQEIQKSQANINSGGGGSNNSKSSISAETTISVTQPSNTDVVKQRQPKITHNFVVKKLQTRTISKPKITPQIAETTPIEKLGKKLDTDSPGTTQTTPEQTVIPNTKPKASDVDTAKSTTPISVSSYNTSTTSPNEHSLSNFSNRFKNTLYKDTNRGAGNNVNKGTGTGNGAGNEVNKGTGSGTGNGVNKGTGTGSGTGNKIDNQPKKEDIPVATAPKLPRENGSKLNRADCIRCEIKYPDRARRRGIEGKAEVAIDTDANGNVTLVRLIRSSGDSELDEAAQQAAQEWKLKPTDIGRQGVRASVNFAIKGSQRHQQLQERQRARQREAAQKKPKKDTYTPTSTESPTPNPKITTPIVTPETPAPSSTTTPESNNNSENSN